ncbi:hypothetical protein GCM10010862_41900 [Devosia nitrariae]|uniref:Outer membrane beta-barrel protein n=1 Tax=Devosia nitrariae TaxID=2071872 RepID=A0ABQ5WA40_9HYPH|nr:hypothetical protein GCM10010862_41900 [Devosia nitrariae]
MERLLSCPARRPKSWPVKLFAGLLLIAAAPIAGAWAADDRLEPDLYPLAPGTPLSPPPAEPAHLPFDVDWSLALRGSFTQDEDGESYEAVLVPRVTLTREGGRSTLVLDTEAELALPLDGETHVEALRLGVSGAYALDSVTDLTGSAALAYEQPNPNDPGVADDVEDPADSISGSVDLGVSRRFGLFSVGLDGGVARTVYGPTIMTGGIEELNGHDNAWTFDTGLRVGYQITPIFEVFGRGSVEREIFDHPVPGLGVKADATQYALVGGLAGNWRGILTAEGSVGVGLRRFDAGALDEITSTLFDARLTYTPDPTVTLSAGFRRTLEAAGVDTSGTARIETRADAELAYTVNRWLRLRASADWWDAELEGSGETEKGYGLGLGTDYRLGAHTQLSADYGFAHTEKSGDTPEDTHRVTVGVTVSR